MYNRIVLMGRICHDLELKTTPAGIAVLSFRIAVDRAYQTKGEDRKADFFNIVAWRATAEFVAKYFGKGRMILIEGELQTRQYTDKNGATQNTVEIIADNARFTGEQKPQNGAPGGNTGYSAGGYQNGSAYYKPETPEAGAAGGAVAASAGAFAETAGTDDDYPF